MNIRKTHGFTIIEVMIVVAIIGIFITITAISANRVSTKSKTNSCITNLRRIDAAKSLWSITSGSDPDDPVSMSDLVPEHIKTTPVCPSGGVYTVGNLKTLATCSVQGHALSAPES